MSMTWTCARGRVMAAAAALAALGGAAFAGPPAPSFKVVKRFELGGEGGWDYLTWDADGRRIFVSRATRVMVVDPESGKVLGEIPDTPGVHGIALAPDIGRGFTSNGRENTVSVFDLKTLQPSSKIKVGENPDAILYEPTTRRVFTFNGRSGDATAVDALAGAVVGTIPLGGKPEFAATDGKRVFVNVEDKSEIVAFDPKELRVTDHWPLKPCEEPTGLAIDRGAGRLFAGCGNKMMAVIDTKTGRVIATPPIGAGVDATAFDPESHLAFSSNGEGSVTVVGESQPGQFSALQTAATEVGARTMALDAKSHRLFLVTARFGERPAATPENPRPRPPILPGSFVMLVLTQ